MQKIIFIFFIFFNITIYFSLEYFKDDKVNKELEHHIRNLEKNYNTYIYNTSLLADNIYNLSVSNKRIIEIMSIASKESTSEAQKQYLRDELYSLTKTTYEVFKENGVVLFNFVFKNNEMFLRVHKPSKFGDDLTNIREDINHANKTQKIIRAFVKGKIAHGFRNAYPLFDKNNKHVGVLEVSFSSEALQREFNTIGKVHTHFLVHKSIFGVKEWDMKGRDVEYTQSIENEDFMTTYVLNKEKHISPEHMKKEIFARKNCIKKKMNFGQPFSLHFKTNNITNVVTFYPITGIDATNIIAWVVSYENNDFIEITLRTTKVLQILSFFILSIIFYFIYRTLEQKKSLKIMVMAKTNSLSKANMELEKSKQELTDLNKELERKVQRQVKDIQSKEYIMQEQAKLAQMGEMLNMIAHQWRQPLNSISASAINMSLKNDLEILDKDEVKSSSDFIQNQVQKMSQIINDFMEFSKEESNSSFYIYKSCENVMEIISAQFKNRLIDIELNVDKNIKVFHNSKNLEHVLLNLVSNSRDAFESKNNIKNKYIKIYSSEDENNIYLKVEDNAGGIPEDIINKIFNPYFTTKEQGKGTGIGLYMSKKMIEQVEGSMIYVEVNGDITTVIIKFKKI